MVMHDLFWTLVASAILQPTTETTTETGPVKRSFLQKKKIASDDQLPLVALDSLVLLSPSIVSFFSSLLTVLHINVTWKDDMFTFVRARKVLNKNTYDSQCTIFYLLARYSCLPPQKSGI